MFYPACTLQRNGRTCNKKAMEQNPGSNTWCALLLPGAVCMLLRMAVVVRDERHRNILGAMHALQHSSSLRAILGNDPAQQLKAQLSCAVR